jgi:predicted RNase H-like nuclease (RuvC/YqgF family)
LREEIDHQEDMITKLGKEKRSVGDSKQKTEENIQALEDKCNHLNKVKGKLEQSLDECEDTLEREKKTKSDVEKLKRKIEGDLKLSFSTSDFVFFSLSKVSSHSSKDCSSLPLTLFK